MANPKIDFLPLHETIEVLVNYVTSESGREAVLVIPIRIYRLIEHSIKQSDNIKKLDRLCGEILFKNESVIKTYPDPEMLRGIKIKNRLWITDKTFAEKIEVIVKMKTRNGTNLIVID